MTEPGENILVIDMMSESKEVADNFFKQSHNCKFFCIVISQKDFWRRMLRRCQNISSQHLRRNTELCRIRKTKLCEGHGHV